MALFLTVVTGGLIVLAFTRFHFSHQDFPGLARLQWSHQPPTVSNGIRPQIVGHRGSGIRSTSGALLVGNTANAIQQGIDAGVDWIEIDVRESHDGHLVVFHDEDIYPKTDRKGKVSELDIDELRAVEVLVNPPERILSLEEAFTRFHADDRKWIFDVKAKGIHGEVLRWLDDKVSKGTLSKDQVMIFGAYEILLDYKDGNYTMGYTAVWRNFGNRLRVLLCPGEITNRCRLLDCNYLVLPVIFANQSIVDAAQSRGIQVWVYGTDDERDLRYLAKCGISGFIVDSSEDAMAVFGNGEVEMRPGVGGRED